MIKIFKIVLIALLFFNSNSLVAQVNEYLEAENKRVSRTEQTEKEVERFISDNFNKYKLAVEVTDEVIKHLREEEDFIILSHTVDPDTDSVGRLKYFADSLKLDVKKWVLLTGTKAALYEAARKSYLLDDQHDESAAIAEQFIHTQLFALVDRSGRVRGIYDGLDKKELVKLEKDIALVLKEGYNGPRFVNGIFQNNPN
jgi:hypothetical protein